ncbi:hypothetical protein [Rhizobium laguerreae]|uniref:hypothetical protein n=1 Tax=Rhizobium laguerreae TaxID=1076926 RepID=UPI001FE75D44|nr:hypothetical protein [Rhizobium laguerreae]
MSTNAIPLDQPKRRINADTRFEAIDFVNRVNFLFDRWQSEELLAAFSDDVIVDHPLGRSAGKEELAAFLKAYEPITHGVRRHNCNHVVDGRAWRRHCRHLLHPAHPHRSIEPGRQTQDRADGDHGI